MCTSIIIIDIVYISFHKYQVVVVSADYISIDSLVLKVCGVTEAFWVNDSVYILLALWTP